MYGAFTLFGRSFQDRSTIVKGHVCSPNPGVHALRFGPDEASDADGLSPVKDDNEVWHDLCRYELKGSIRTYTNLPLKLDKELRE